MDTQIERLERLFRALADATRLRILGLLLTGEVCVCDIHDTLTIPQPKASRHLAYLRRAGLVAARREGLWMYYRLAETDDAVVDAVRQAAAHALTHIAGVRKAASRLEKKTGCCLPATSAPSTRGCCEPPTRSAGRG
jgi:ArsR family transcriptional regulator